MKAEDIISKYVKFREGGFVPQENPYDRFRYNTSDNTRVVPTQQKVLTTEEAKKQSQSFQTAEALRKKQVQAQKDAEVKDRMLRIAESEYAKTQPVSAENLSKIGNALGDKMRFSYEPNVFDDYLNPFVYLGNMAGGIGNIPANIKSGNYGQAAFDIVNPVLTGGMASAGSKNATGFVNELFNPVAGLDEALLNKASQAGKYLTTQTPLKDVYKLNPWAFKPNPEMGYRMLGKEGFEDALNTGVLRAKPVPNQPTNGGISLARNRNRNPNTGRMQPALDRPYFADGFIDERYAADYMAAVNKADNNLVPIPTHKGIAPSQAGSIPLENATLYKKDWLKGYKQIDVPKQLPSSGNVKSEIDWAKWNKEIPENKVLMQEYNVIEQTSKANGTWMKNPDGSVFQGTPEQFVQQNSENFKKAFPKGYNKVYRGGDNENLASRPHPIVFTGDKATAQHYTGGSEFANNIATPEQYGGRALFDLYHPKSNTSITINNQGRSWREIPRKHFGDSPPPRDLHNPKGDFTSTDDIAKWMVENNKNSVRLNNIFDSYDAEFVDIINHKPGNYLKSAVGNNGMFDMTNPNIYKGLIPPVAIGAGALLNNQQQEAPQFQQGGRVPIYVDSKNDPRYKAYNDSLNLYNIQNQFNKDFFNRHPFHDSVNNTNNPDIDLINIIRNSPANTQNAYYAFMNLVNDNSTSNRIYRPEHSGRFNTQIKPGFYTPNSVANSSNVLERITGTEDTKSKPRIKTKNIVKREGDIAFVKNSSKVSGVENQSTLFERRPTINYENFGSTYSTVEHPNINPVNTIKLHEHIASGRRTGNQRSLPYGNNVGGNLTFVEPSLINYDDILLRNIELPVYKKPEQPIDVRGDVRTTPTLQQSVKLKPKPTERMLEATLPEVTVRPPVDYSKSGLHYSIGVDKGKVVYRVGSVGNMKVLTPAQFEEFKKTPDFQMYNEVRKKDSSNVEQYLTSPTNAYPKMENGGEIKLDKEKLSMMMQKIFGK